MGELAETNRDSKYAEACYRMAAQGDSSVSDDMYYNDNPVDYVFIRHLLFASSAWKTKRGK